MNDPDEVMSLLLNMPADNSRPPPPLPPQQQQQKLESSYTYDDGRRANHRGSSSSGGSVGVGNWSMYGPPVANFDRKPPQDRKRRFTDDQQDNESWSARNSNGWGRGGALSPPYSPQNGYQHDEETRSKPFYESILAGLVPPAAAAEGGQPSQQHGHGAAGGTTAHRDSYEEEFPLTAKRQRVHDDTVRC
jgi:hypothetical protein